MWCLVSGFRTFIPYQLFNFFFCSDLKAFRGHDGEKVIFLTRLDTNLPRIQGARPDHVRVESSSRCFPRELVSFVRPWELRADYMSRAGSVEVCRDDCSARYYMRRASPPAAKLRSCRVKDGYIEEHESSVFTRAEKGWAMKQACPSKKVWCSGLGSN